MSRWEWGTPEDAAAVHAAMSGMGLLCPGAGAMEPDRLLVAKDGDRRIGWLYFIPDSHYTILAELYISRPAMMYRLKEALAMIWERFPSAGPLVGYIGTNQMRYANALVKMGAELDKISVQVRVAK